MGLFSKIFGGGSFESTNRLFDSHDAVAISTSRHGDAGLTPRQLNYVLESLRRPISPSDTLIAQSRSLPTNCSQCGKRIGDKNGDYYYTAARVKYAGAGDYDVIHNGATNVIWGVYYCNDCCPIPDHVGSTFSGRVTRDGDPVLPGDCCALGYGE